MRTVHASHITDTTIRCPCSCKRGFHLFGSNGDLSSRVEHRSSHCCIGGTALCIVIDEDTVRGVKMGAKSTKRRGEKNVSSSKR